jgi:hypothetical protein
MVKRVLVVVCLVVASGCLGEADGGDSPRGAPANSEIEVKQGALPVGCAHSPCRTGVLLTAGCGPNACVAWICGVDPFCCTNSWDSWCVQEVASICQLRCDCGQICQQGNAYYPDACNCTAQVYGVDPYCGQTAWDAQCVGEANNLCGTGCP